MGRERKHKEGRVQVEEVVDIHEEETSGEKEKKKTIYNKILDRVHWTDRVLLELE